MFSADRLKMIFTFMKDRVPTKKTKPFKNI